MKAIVAVVLCFQLNANFPSWTSQVRSPSGLRARIRKIKWDQPWPRSQATSALYQQQVLGGNHSWARTNTGFALAAVAGNLSVVATNSAGSGVACPTGN